MLKRPMISPINEIVSIDERPVTNEHAGKIQSRLEHLSKSERKVAEVILATPSRPFIRASPPSPLRPGLANRPSIASAVVSKPADSLTSNCIWPRALRTARSMLTGMSMKTTALSHTRENIRIGHGEFRSGAPFSRHVGGKSRGGSADSGQKSPFSASAPQRRSLTTR